MGPLISLATLSLFLCLAVPALAEGAGADESGAGGTNIARVEQSLMGSIMSPFCPGKTIDSCPSPLAEVWRKDIRTWVAGGVGGEEIRMRLQARTPSFDISGRPGAKWDWALPVAAMAMASLWLVTRVLRLRRKEDHDGVTGAAVTNTARDAFDERLDRELREPQQ